MCGIIGCIGVEKAVSSVLSGLKKLEYRGYDSWGIASLHDGRIGFVKNIGKIGEVSSVELEGSVAVGQTRWATHGGVTKENAHPHLDCKQEIAVVHNGIIENHEELKKKLIEQGHEFKSQTDTEVIPHLIEEKLGNGLDFEEAVEETCNSLDGRFAFVVLKKDEKKLVGARRGSPLVLGIGANAFFLASDVTAFLPYTRKVVFLDDNELIAIASEPRVINFRKRISVQKQVQEISWTAEEAEKGEHPHYLIKEILEQRFTVMQALNQDDREIQKIASWINNAFGTYSVGCGTAGKVALTASYLFSKIAGKHVNFAIGSEFPQYKDFLTPQSLLIAISQSGETADTLEAIEAIKNAGGRVASIINVMGSTMQRSSDEFLLVNAGPEKAVCSTKATTGQLAIVALLAFACAGKLREGRELLKKTAMQANEMLSQEFIERIKALAKKLKDFESIYIIGRGVNYPMALEAAIKLQEVSCIHAEGFAGGELKHGPLALISKGTPCIALVANDETKKDILSNAMETKARGGYMIGIAPEHNEVFDFFIKVPDAGVASPIANIIPIHLLAYFIALERGNDPDYCKNLAKSVTVK